MFSRSLISFSILLLSACSMQPAEPVSAPIVAPERVIAADPTPDTCELLLTSLEETRPLLDQLDETIAAQADRIDLAVERLDQPPPVQPAPLACPEAGPATIGDKEVIGALEWLYIETPGQHYRARIDSGAETSSMSASDVVEFERDGDDWVRFNFQHETTDEAVAFELPIKRRVRVRRASAEGVDRRFVVEIDVRMGDQLTTTEFTLSDRTGMNYPVVLGRAFLLDLYVVDVARTYTQPRYEAS